MKKLITKTFINKLIEETAFKDAVKREKTAEGKMQYILEEIAVALKKKGVTEFEGQNYTLKVR
jgi:hypothetical protein